MSFMWVCCVLRLRLRVALKPEARPMYVVEIVNDSREKRTSEIASTVLCRAVLLPSLRRTWFETETIGWRFTEQLDPAGKRRMNS